MIIDTSPMAAACGCEWTGAFCPHCGRGTTGGGHVIRCHRAAVGGEPDADVAYGAPVRLRDPKPTNAPHCPNDPPCPHWLHDIEDWDDKSPTCCTDGCDCGKRKP